MSNFHFVIFWGGAKDTSQESNIVKKMGFTVNIGQNSFTPKNRHNGNSTHLYPPTLLIYFSRNQRLMQAKRSFLTSAHRRQNLPSHRRISFKKVSSFLFSNNFFRSFGASFELKVEKRKTFVTDSLIARVSE